MTYNIRYDNPGDGVNSWSNRKEKVFDLIKKHNPDIVGLQEGLKHQLDDLVSALPGYTYIGAGREDGKTKGEYSAILYKKDRFNTDDVSTWWLSDTPDVAGSVGWDAALARVVTEAKFYDKKSKKTFWYLNTHFDHIGTEARKQSAIRLQKRAASLGVAVLVSGDLNCERAEPPYPELIKDAVLKDPAPKDAQGTFCTFVVNGPKCNPIDYILHTKHWKASDYKVITDNDGKHYPSDHLPVMVTVRQ